MTNIEDFNDKLYNDYQKKLSSPDQSDDYGKIETDNDFIQEFIETRSKEESITQEEMFHVGNVELFKDFTSFLMNTENIMYSQIDSIMAECRMELIKLWLKYTNK